MERQRPSQTERQKAPRAEVAPNLIYVSAKENILFPINNEQLRQKQMLLAGIHDAGFAIVTPVHLLAAARYITTHEGTSMPSAGEELTSQKAKGRLKKEQKQFAIDVLSKLKITVEGTATHYTYEEHDITPEVEFEAAEHTDERLREDWKSSLWVDGMREVVKDMTESLGDRKLAYIDTTLFQPGGKETMHPVINVVTAQDGTTNTNGDTNIHVTTTDHVHTQITEVADTFNTMRTRRNRLHAAIQNREIEVVSQFEREQWPSHPVMNQLKKEAAPVVKDVMRETGLQCDPLDLLYQTLFRATTLPVADVFQNGDRIEAHLREIGAYDNWRNLLSLDPWAVTQPINHDLVRSIVEEQAIIVGERIASTQLPVEDILGRKGIFGEAGWQMVKSNGNVFAIRPEGDRLGEDSVEKKRVEFVPVDTDLAKEFHRVFHYIHTPRAEKAFGLFLEGEELPFSIVAFDAIDRDYKKDLLLMQGYDPEKCLDLARLYSRPGTPFNTSSTIFTLAFEYFRQNEPDVQATLSAFMPSYAHGMSMISAGFNDGVLIKPGKHTFGKKEIDGTEVWEHLTNRRSDESQETALSQWPLLPVMELLAPIQRRTRFSQFPEVKDKMIVVK